MSPAMGVLILGGLTLIFVAPIIGVIMEDRAGRNPRDNDPWVLEHTDVYGRTRWQPRREPMGLYEALVLEAADGYHQMWTSSPGRRNPKLYRSKARAARVARRAEFKVHGFYPGTTKGR